MAQIDPGEPAALKAGEKRAFSMTIGDDFAKAAAKGLEPKINDSGTESHGGRMVKRGSSQLRYVLMNCTLPLIRFDMTFAQYYAKKRKEGKPHRVALTHLAKKLVRIIFALERQQINYDPSLIR